MWWWWKPIDPPAIGPGADSLLGEINAYRRRNGKPPLDECTVMNELCADHCADMAASGQMSHDGFAGRAQASGYAWCAENVAYGYRDAEAVVRAWSRSSGHRKNMLGPYTHCGTGEDSRYWCAMFGR